MEAFEGSKNAFKTLKEKVKIASKKAIKHAKKVAGIHLGPTTEANPSYFLVISAQGAMVRKEIGLESKPVHGLNRGDLVTCVEILGRRARIIEPVEGWVSIRTQDNESILMKTIAPDISVQVGQMEKRFAKLKSQQPHADDIDLVVPAAGQATSLPDVAIKESDVTSVSTMKHILTFKDSQSSMAELTIPKLAMPGSTQTGPKTITATNTQDLLDLFSDGVARPSNVPCIDTQSNDLQILTPVVQLSPQGKPIQSVTQSQYIDPFSDLLNQPTACTKGMPVVGTNVDRRSASSLQDWFS